MIEIFVPGDPKAMQTGRVVRAGIRLIPIRRHTEWAQRVALAAHAVRPKVLLDGPLGVTVIAFRTRPKSLPKRVQFPTARPDLESYLKALDALQGIIFLDDARIVRLFVEKVFANDMYPPGLLVRIWPL